MSYASIESAKVTPSREALLCSERAGVAQVSKELGCFLSSLFDARVVGIYDKGVDAPLIINYGYAGPV